MKFKILVYKYFALRLYHLKTIILSEYNVNLLKNNLRIFIFS